MTIILRSAHLRQSLLYSNTANKLLMSLRANLDNWQEVFVESHKPDRKEELARLCFPADSIGDELTYMVLLEDTNQLVARSNVRPAKDPLYPNLRLRPETDDLHVPFVGRMPGFEDPTPTPAHPPSPMPVTVETVTEDTDETVSPTGRT